MQDVVQRASSPGHSLRGPVVVRVVRTALQEWGAMPYFMLVGGYPRGMLDATSN